MADVKRILIGGIDFPSTAASGFANFTLDQTTDQLEVIFQAEEAITITRAAMRHGTTTGTSPTYIMSLQGVDGSGLPDGTVKGGGSPVSIAFSPSGLGYSSNTFNWINFANSYVCTRGEWLALVIAYSSGTVDGSNKSSFTSYIGYTTSNRHPYSIQNEAGTRTKSAGGPPVFGYGSSSKAYGLPMSATTALSFNQGTSGADEYAVKLAPDLVPSGTYTIKGVRFTTAPTAGGSTLIQLYSGGGASDMTVLQSVTYDHDSVNTAASYGLVEVFFQDTTLATLNFGSAYRIGFQPQSTTNFVLNAFDVAAAADLDAYPGGQEVSTSTRLNTGNWTDVATRRLFVELILGDITAPAGAEADYPAETDVRAGVDYADAAMTGTCAVPGAADVRFGEDVDATTGTCHVPAAADVEFGVNVDATTGMFVVPTEAQVEEGIDFGAAAEFTGTLVTGGGPSADTIAAAVWAYTAGSGRILTAGTNIVLAKGTGVTGFSDPSAADVWAAGTRTLTAFAFTADANLVEVDGKAYVAGVDGVVTSNITHVLGEVATNPSEPLEANMTQAAGQTVTATGTVDLDNLDAAISSRSTLDATGVWAAGTRTLTAFGFSVTASTVSDKTGYKLASDGLDSVSATPPSGRATMFREMVIQVWMRWFNRTALDLDAGTLKTYAADGTTVITTQTITNEETLQEWGTSS